MEEKDCFISQFENILNTFLFSKNMIKIYCTGYVMYIMSYYVSVCLKNNFTYLVNFNLCQCPSFIGCPVVLYLNTVSPLPKS